MEFKETLKAAVKVAKGVLILFIIWGTYQQISTNIENGAENVFAAFMGDGDPGRSKVVETVQDEEEYLNQSTRRSAYRIANILESTVNEILRESLSSGEVVFVDLIDVVDDYQEYQFEINLKRIYNDGVSLLKRIEVRPVGDDLEFYCEGDYIGGFEEFVYEVQNIYI